MGGMHACFHCWETVEVESERLIRWANGLQNSGTVSWSRPAAVKWRWSSSWKFSYERSSDLALNTIFEKLGFTDNFSKIERSMCSSENFVEQNNNICSFIYE